MEAEQDPAPARAGSACRCREQVRSEAEAGARRTALERRGLVDRSRRALEVVADWDATSYDPTPPHCLRRVDTNLHYPEDLVGQVHADGEIGSRALWDIRGAIGHVRADTVILEGQFDFPGTTMTKLANRTVAAAHRLYGNATAQQERAAFVARGILS